MNFKHYKYRLPETKSRYFIIFLSLAGYLFLLPVILLDYLKRKRTKQGKIQKILVVRNDGIGDFILSLPALHLLRKTFKAAHITALIPGWQKELALASNIFDETIDFNDEKGKYFSSLVRFKMLFLKMLSKVPALRKEKFDIAIDMRGDMRNRIVIFFSGIPCRIGFDIGGMEYLLTHCIHYKKEAHEVEHFNDLISSCAGNNLTEDVEFAVPFKDKEIVGQFLKDNDIHFGQDTLIIVHPVSRWLAKEWPKEKFSELCDRLINQCRAKVIIVGAAEEVASINKITSLMKERPALFTGNLLQLAALIEKANLFIGNDAAPMHMAALLKTPTIGLFGPTDPEIFGPYGKGHSVVRPDTACLCNSKKVCAKPERFCMDGITVDRVFNLTRKYIKH